MRLIFLMTLAGTLAIDPLNANKRVSVGNQNNARSEPATFVIDGKFTVQLLVSIKPTEEEIVQRRMVFANRRRPNRKEMSAHFRKEITSQLADRDAMLRTKVANNNRTANEGQTARPKNRFNRLPTSTTPYPNSRLWDSLKTKDVKGSVRPVPTSSRPRINRIRTTTLRSPVSRKTHFAVEQGFYNGPNKTRALLNPNPTAMTNNTVAVFQEHQKTVDTIDLETAANPKGKAIESLSDGAPLSHLIRGSSQEEPDGEASIVGKNSTPISQDSIVGKDYTAKQQPTAQTVEMKLPLPLNWRKPIPKDSEVFDVAPGSDGQVFHVNETLTAQDVQNSTLTNEPVPKHLPGDKLLDVGYDNEHEKSITSDKAIYDENKEGDSFSKNEETGTNPTMENENAPSVNGPGFAFPFDEGQVEDIAKFNEPIFRHSFADRDFSSEITTPASDFTTSTMEVIHPNNLTVNMPASLDHIPAVNEPEVFDEITTVMDISPVTEILPTATHDQSSNEDPNDFPWKKIGDIEMQMNPLTREVVNIKSQTISGVHFIMATSHIRISLHTEESHFPWNRIGDFEVQIDPHTKQVVNIRTGTNERTTTSDLTNTPFEQHHTDSREQHQPNFNPDGSQIESTTEVLINKTETVTTVPLQTSPLPTQEPGEDSTELKHGYDTQVNQEADKEVNVRMQITTSIPAQSPVNEEQEDLSSDMPSLPTTINRRRPSVSDKSEEISIEMDDDGTSRKKKIVRVDDRVRAIRVRRPSSSNSEEHDVFLIRYVDDEDDVPVEPERARVNTINLKKKKVVIVNENRDGRGFHGQRGDSPTRKESPYFYYHYDTSRALASSSCNFPLLVCSVLLLFFNVLTE
ncbi:hypothetical protein GHT06_012450 [Daphnia sinensis]|uniref:Uncharacterized protein n=1 Tax=Daphnia sinensis TaxID=1820382 RepID=A0AAD5KVX4_9CRUS|nr:hypothetical protein GHT06_012450 [Daphnia sinensis]